MKHIINTNKKPFIPYPGWTVEEHIKGGKLEWNPENVKLYVSEEQKNGYIEGNKLRKLVKNPLNANVLDYLYKHQELIPDKWKGKYVYFWGTIYRHSGGYLCVRCLFWDVGQWHCCCGWLGGDWLSVAPAAVPASPLGSETEPSSSDTLPLELTINGAKYRKLT